MRQDYRTNNPHQSNGPDPNTGKLHVTCIMSKLV